MQGLIYVLIALVAQPAQVDPQTGEVHQVPPKPAIVQQYDSLASCKLDLPNFDAAAKAYCTPRLGITTSTAPVN